MSLRPIRIYVENSVIGGYYDKEFEVPTRRLFELFRQGVYKPVISKHVWAELNDGAPKRVKDILTSIDYEKYEITDEMGVLSRKYLDEKIVTEKFKGDALHIAIATILGVDLLVSWNFKHIVNYNKIRLFNAVNYREGYKILDIRTPQEVIENE